MANLTRYKQKIFANNSNQVGVFGTGVDKETSKNVETLQSEAYEGGWSEAIITNKNYPIWQEMDGVQYGFSYQLAYLLQKGIPQWLATETYYTNDYCRVGSKIYYSLQDNNIGKNPTSESTYWTPLLTANRSIGEVITSTIPLTEAGLHLLDGSLIQGTGIYADFVTYMANLTATHPERFTTEANWQASVASNGLCSQFVYDSVNNTVRLPKWGNIAYTKQYTLTLASTVPVRGNGIALGITNGTDLLGLANNSPNGFSGYTGLYGKGVGATWSGSNPSVANLGTGVTTDGTKSGLVANTSGVAGLTNDPLSCYYYIVVATSTKTDIQVDIDEIATDLNGKADVDLTNLSTTGKAKGANLAMPSSSSTSFTLGASGAKYQAPADGWMTCMLNNLTSLQLYCGDLQSFAQSTNATYLACTLPIKKGTNAVIYYGGGTPTYSKVWFVYAEGTKV